MDGVLGGGMMRPGAAPRRFDEYYRCYPVAMLPGPERENVNHGGKVIMPPSALDKLTRLHITYPMLFELHNGAKERMTHAGVLEFIAEEGKIYLPFWVSAVKLRGCWLWTSTDNGFVPTAHANLALGAR
jgi:ubiquitin fusion degradation protein 1